MLRKLIGRPVIAVVMATIGLASILRGVGPFTIFSGTKPLPLPIRDEPFMLGPLFIPPIQLLGAGVSLAFLAGFGWFFLKSRKGIAMRAVADNQQVAMAMGIDVERYFGVAWAMTGIVSALGGDPLGQPARRRHQPGAGRLQGVPGGDPGRSRLDSRRDHRRPDRRRRREHRGGLRRSRTSAAAPGLRALRAHDPRADDPARTASSANASSSASERRHHRAYGGGAGRGARVLGPRGTRPHCPARLGSIPAQRARVRLGGNGSQNPSPHAPPAAASPHVALRPPSSWLRLPSVSTLQSLGLFRA